MKSFNDFFLADNQFVVLVFSDYSCKFGFLRVKKLVTDEKPEISLIPLNDENCVIANFWDDERLFDENSERIKYDDIMNCEIIPKISKK